MTPRETLLWEAKRHLDQRPVRPHESGPAAWLVVTVGLALALAVLWLLGQVVLMVPPRLALGAFSLACLIAAGWLWGRLR
jgi:hypothetical protein